MSRTKRPSQNSRGGDKQTQSTGPFTRDARLDESLGYLVRRTNHAFVNRLEEALAGHGISSTTWFFLRRLWDEDGMTQRELADALGLTPPTAVSAIDILERQGLVERRLNGSDRRKRHIFLTAKARKLVRELRHRGTAVNEIALAELTVSEALQLTQLLHTVSDSLLRRSVTEHAPSLGKAASARRK